MAPKGYTLLMPDHNEKDLPLYGVEPKRSQNMERACFWCVATLTGIMVIFAALTLLVEYGDQVISTIDSRLPEWTKGGLKAAPTIQGDMPLILQIIAPPQFVEGNPKTLQVWFNAQSRESFEDEQPQPLLEAIDFGLPLESAEDEEPLAQPFLVNKEPIGEMVEEFIEENLS